MEIILNKKKLAPIFENVIIKNNKEKNKNIMLISEKTKPISFKGLFNKSILYIRLYDQNLYLYKNNTINKNKAIIEPKFKEENNINKIIIKKVQKNQNLNNLNRYGDGKIKMLSSINKKELNIKNFNIKKEILPNMKKYIKNISTFNYELASYKNIVFQFNKNYKNSNININKYIYLILEYTFRTMSSLISRPVIIENSSEIIIQIFFYLNKKIFISEKKSKFLYLNKDKLQLLCSYLSKLYKKPIELELDRLYYPYFDSNILSNMIGFISNIVKFRIIIRKLFFVAKLKKSTFNNLKFSLLPSFLSGLKIKLAGRLRTQKIIPRITVKSIQKGTLARGKANFVNSARFTNKNKRGTYSITVTMGHIFF